MRCAIGLSICLVPLDCQSTRFRDGYTNTEFITSESEQPDTVVRLRSVVAFLALAIFCGVAGGLSVKYLASNEPRVATVSRS